jgi:hypothetical protein
MKYLLLACGCAECRFGLDEPLIDAHGPFDSIEEAKAEAWNSEEKVVWKEHPQGGWFHADGQGDDWILPVPDDFTIKSKESG